MNALLLAFLGLVGIASAQRTTAERLSQTCALRSLSEGFPPRADVADIMLKYSCAPGFCSTASGLDRADVFGCLYFCYLDVTPDESLERTEFHTRFAEWTGGDAEATLDEFLVIHRDIIPACDTELTAAFDRLSVLDTVAGTISSADIDAWVDQVAAIQGGEPILAAAFQSWFRVLYTDINDPTCTIPVPA